MAPKKILRVIVCCRTFFAAPDASSDVTWVWVSLVADFVRTKFVLILRFIWIGSVFLGLDAHNSRDSLGQIDSLEFSRVIFLPVLWLLRKNFQARWWTINNCRVRPRCNWTNQYLCNNYPALSIGTHLAIGKMQKALPALTRTNGAFSPDLFVSWSNQSQQRTWTRSY